MKRVSYDTSIKHSTRHRLLQDILIKEQTALISSSNSSRWKQESDDKYQYREVHDILTQEVNLIKRLSTTISFYDKSHK